MKEDLYKSNDGGSYSFIKSLSSINILAVHDFLLHKINLFNLHDMKILKEISI